MLYLQPPANGSGNFLLATRYKTPTLTFGILLATLGASAQAQQWNHYGGGQHGMQYSAASQINRDNVAQLEEVWRFRTGELSEDQDQAFSFQANPIVAEGKLYFPTGSAIVFALDPATGKQIWRTRCCPSSAAGSNSARPR